MMPRQDPDQRLGLHIGYVTNREDPDNLGRVKVCVPGLLEPESAKWCWPLGVGGGYAQWGTFDPPPVNATVGVLFNQGNIEEPYFLTGPWGAPDEESDVPEGSTIHSDDTQVVVTEDKQWKISRDSHDLEQHYELIHKDQEIAINIDNVPGTGQTIHIHIGAAGPFFKAEDTPSNRKAEMSSGGPAIHVQSTNSEIGINTGVGPSIVLNASGITISMSSPPEIKLDSGGVKLGVATATEKVVLGTAYRSDEATFLTTLISALQAFTNATKVATVEPTLGPASNTLDGVLISLQSDNMLSGSHDGYLSQNVKVQE